MLFVVSNKGDRDRFIFESGSPHSQNVKTSNWVEKRDLASFCWRCPNFRQTCSTFKHPFNGQILAQGGFCLPLGLEYSFDSHLARPESLRAPWSDPLLRKGTRSNSIECINFSGTLHRAYSIANPRGNCIGREELTYKRCTITEST